LARPKNNSTAANSTAANVGYEAQLWRMVGALAPALRESSRDLEPRRPAFPPAARGPAHGPHLRFALPASGAGLLFRRADRAMRHGHDAHHRLGGGQRLPEPEFEVRRGGLRVPFVKDLYTPERLRAMGLNERQVSAVLHAKGGWRHHEPGVPGTDRGPETDGLQRPRGFGHTESTGESRPHREGNPVRPQGARNGPEGPRRR